jgi:hypothetical protein
MAYAAELDTSHLGASARPSSRMAGPYLPICAVDRNADARAIVRFKLQSIRRTITGRSSRSTAHVLARRGSIQPEILTVQSARPSSKQACRPRHAESTFEQVGDLPCANQLDHTHHAPLLAERDHHPWMRERDVERYPRSATRLRTIVDPIRRAQPWIHQPQAGQVDRERG